MSAHPNARLETFCDGVFAIALTLLIIDIKIPGAAAIATSADLWRALARLLPSVFAFVLSFGIIFISWVNHHEGFKLLDKSSMPFVYANALLMLGIVFVPFPTALLGEHLFTPHAAPAVVLYSATGVLMSVGWAFMSRTSLPLSRSDRGAERIRKAGQNALFAMAFYTSCAILAVWWPLAIAVLITVMWVYWVIYGIRTSRDTRLE